MGAHAQRRLNRPDDPRYSRILHHATSAFLTQGYDKANLELIAIAAGVGKPTVYEFFSNKDGLFKAAMEEALYATVHPLWSVPLDPTQPVEETLTTFSRRYFEAMYHPVAPNSPPFFRICRLVIAASFQDEGLGEHFLRYFEENCYPVIQSYLTALVEMDKIPPVNVPLATGFFFEFVLGTYDAFFGRPSVPSVDFIARNMRRRIRAFLLGLPAFVNEQEPNERFRTTR